MSKKRLFDAQLSSVEGAPRGRAERYCDYDLKTERFNCGERRADARTKPQLETQFEFPVGVKRGVSKPHA